MSLTARIALPGGSIPAAWSIRLAPGTPLEIRNKVELEANGFAYIVVTPVRLADIPAAATLVGFSRYTGMLRSFDTDSYEMSGPSAAWALGDEDDKGYLIENATGSPPDTYTTATWQAMITGLIPANLDVGTISALGGSFSWVFTYCTRRDALTLATLLFDTAEYRVNPNLTVDAGLQAALYPTTTTPTAIVQAKPGGRDINVTGIPATRLSTLTDLDDYVTRIALRFNDVEVGAANFTTPYYDINGNRVGLTKFVDAPADPGGDANTVAASYLTGFTATRRQITVATDLYDIGRDVAVGDTIMLWDPDNGLTDITNPVQYRGETIYPLEVRVFGQTFPVEAGMGVYVIAPTLALTVTDLTDWVEFESPGCALEVGATPRSISS